MWLCEQREKDTHTKNEKGEGKKGNLIGIIAYLYERQAQNSGKIIK